jgi:acyl transferase domain-containing protein
MKLPVVFMFSGQGSQYYQMGKQLFATNKTFNEWMLKSDHIYHDLTGQSLLTTLYNENTPRSEPFKETLLSHPAIFMIEYALYRVLLENDIEPDYLLGASMGEFAAAAAADILSFESALTAVIEQAKTLRVCPEAGMLAILADPNLYYQDTYLQDNTLALAATNFSSHFVVTATNPNLLAVTDHLKGKHIPSQLLPVSVGFHSELIDTAKNSFLAAIDMIQFNKPHKTYISCMSAGNPVLPDKLHLWNVIREPIQFQATIEALEKEAPLLYIDVGPSGTLATFIKYNLSGTSQSKYVSLLTPFGDSLKSFNDAITTILTN